MKTITLLVALLILSVRICFAQVDTLYSLNSKIPCLVKEITPELVKYSFPGEDLVNSVYKNTVRKIVFKSGRVETFAAPANFKKVTNLHAFDNVTITQVESEIKGLVKIGEVSSIAQGGSVFSGTSQMENRAEMRLKIFAAMMGGNIIYLTQNQTSKGGTSGYINTPVSTPAQTFMTGVVYTSEVPDIEQFKAKLAGKTEFNAVESASFTGTTTAIRVYPSKRTLHLKSIKNINGLLTIEGDLEGASKYKTFNVASFDADFFHIYYEDKGTAYNLKIKM